MTFDIEYAKEIFPELFKASIVTVQATLLSFVVAALLGLGIALARRSRIRAIRGVVFGVVEFIRTTPLLIQLFFLFYVLPEYGIVLSPLLTGVAALGIHYSCYMSEVYRAGLASVPAGQWEVAMALQFPRGTTLRRIALPQAVRAVIAPLGNYLVAMFKETAILSVITVQELLGAAMGVAALSFRYLEPISIVGMLFLLYSAIASAIVRRLDRRET